MTAHYSKTIVCLANSRKPPEGRCVAGREINSHGFGGWVRAVSPRPTHELTLEERAYRDGQDPKVLDVISIAMKTPQAHLHQKENHVIDCNRPWEKKGIVDWKQLESAVEDPAGPLWINGYSSYHGRNDRIPLESLEELTRSLYLVRTERIILRVASEGDVLGPLHRRVRAGFFLCGHPYALVVTDPWIETDYLPKEDGRYPIGEAILCISLGEIYHGYAYKLAATVITPQRAAV